MAVHFFGATSSPTKTHAIELYHGLLVKWTSNSRAVLSAIPENERADVVKSLDLDQETLRMEGALGIHSIQNSH